LLSDTAPVETAGKRWTILLVSAVALFFLYFFGLTRTGLIGPDEPRYAAIGQAMAQTGDWITPRLWGNSWFEKPPLLYWMTAAGFKAGLGQDLAPRLPVALASVGFLIYFFLALRRQFDEQVAFYSTTILATSTGWLAFSHVAVTDLPMSAAFGAAMLEAIKTAPTPSRSRLGNTLYPSRAGILLGLAILAKGLVPLVLFLPALWFLRHRVRDLLVILSTAALVAAPWYIAVTWTNGTAFLQEFFWKHHLERFLTGALLHERPFWFYVPVLLAGLFPWSPLIVLLFSKPLYSDRRVRFLTAWFAWGLIFFSLSRNKLPGYLLPLLPPLALLIGLAIQKAQARAAKIVALVAISAALLGFVPAIQDVLPQALRHGFSRAQFHLPILWIVPALVLALICVLLERAGQRQTAIGLIAAGVALFVIRLVSGTYPLLDQQVSPRSFWISHSESVTCSSEKDRSWRYGLNYYAGRDVPDCN
jgi:4-amino-4-deoxy-L-arabinose transferase-like glycosyltransferase